MAEIDPELLKDYKFFQSIKEDLLTKHNGKVALVKNEELIGVYDTTEAAYAEGIKRFGNVPLLIARIQAEESIVQIPSLQLGLLNARV